MKLHESITIYIVITRVSFFMFSVSLFVEGDGGVTILILCGNYTCCFKVFSGASTQIQAESWWIQVE